MNLFNYIYCCCPASHPATGWGDKKHEIYVAAFGSHLFYDLFLQGWGEGAWPPRHPPGSATVVVAVSSGIIVGYSAVKIEILKFNHQVSCFAGQSK